MSNDNAASTERCSDYNVGDLLLRRLQRWSGQRKSHIAPIKAQLKKDGLRMLVPAKHLVTVNGN